MDGLCVVVADPEGEQAFRLAMTPAAEGHTPEGWYFAYWLPEERREYPRTASALEPIAFRGIVDRPAHAPIGPSWVVVCEHDAGPLK